MIDKKKVKAYCALKGIALYQLAEKIGLDSPALSMILKRANTSTNNLYKIAKVLDCKMDDLMIND